MGSKAIASRGVAIDGRANERMAETQLVPEVDEPSLGCRYHGIGIQLGQAGRPL